MSQLEAGPSASAAIAAATDDHSQKGKIQQPHKAQQRDMAVDHRAMAANNKVDAAQNRVKAAENRAKAQQNQERAAQNRIRKPNNVSFAEDRAVASPPATQGDASTSATPSQGAAKQPKRQNKKDALKPQALREGKAPTAFKSKVVIRRLPPNLPEEVFWKAVSPWVRDASDCQTLAGAAAAAGVPAQTSTEAASQGGASTPTSAAVSPASTIVSATVDYKQFVPGKLKNDANKQNKYARAYVRFLDVQSLVAFHKAFDGHIFRDSKGKESVAIVEFAPYQTVVLPPSAANQRRGRRAKADAKQGTIENDAEYLSFVERLNKAGDDVKRSEGDLLASLHDPKGKEKEKEAKQAAGKATPLLLHLRAVKMAKVESAAALKKAKKMEKAATKAAAAGKPVGPGKVAANAEEKAKAKKNKKKEKAKAKAAAAAAATAAAAEGGVKADEATKSKKEKNRKRKGKVPEAADGSTQTPKEALVPVTKTPSSSKSAANKKPVAKAASGNAPNAINQPTAGAQVEGEAKGKSKNKPSRRKPGPKDKEQAKTAAPQPAKVQILKRES